MPANEDHHASKQLLKYIKDRKPARKSSPAAGWQRCVQSADGDDTVVAEKFSEFFTPAFTDETFGEISTPNTLSVANLVEEPDQSELKSGNTRLNKEARC